MVSAIERWASGLRFPRLLFLTAALFVTDMLVPDVIPLVDEILLALLALLLASIRRRETPRQEIDVTPRSGPSSPR